MHHYNSETITIRNEPYYVTDRTDISLYQIVPGHCDRVQFQIPSATRPDIGDFPGLKINVYDPASPSTLLYTWTVDQAYVRDDSVLPDPSTYDLIEVWLVNDDGTPADACFGGLGPIIGDPDSIWGSTTGLPMRGARQSTAVYCTASHRYVAFYQDTYDFQNKTYAHVGEKIGDVVVWSSAIDIGLSVGGANNVLNHAIYDPVNDRVVLFYREDGWGKLFCRVGLVSGSNITFGSDILVGGPAGIPLAQNAKIAATYDTTANRIIVCTSDLSDGNTGYATVVEVDTSTETINSGTPVQWDTVSIATNDTKDEITVSYDPINDITVIGYRDDNTNQCYAICGVVTGATNSIAFPGSRTLITTCSYTRGIYSACDTAIGTTSFSYLDPDADEVRMVTGTISGTPAIISFGSPISIYGETGNGDGMEFPIVYNPDTEEIVAFCTGKLIGGTVAYISDTSSGSPTAFDSGHTIPMPYDSGYKIPIFNSDTDEIYLCYVMNGNVIGRSFYTNSATKPTDFYLISQSLVPGVSGGWLKMRPYSYNPTVKADADKLYQGQFGVHIGKDLTIKPTIDAEVKIIPSSIYIDKVHHPSAINWWEFDTISIKANEEFRIETRGVDIYDIYIRAAYGAGVGEARIFIAGTGYGL